jgi:hypothetical protein
MEAIQHKMAIEYLETAWDKVTRKTINGVGKKLLPNYIDDFEGAGLTVKHSK